MKPLDKKQIPQVVALAVLALAFFGYFAMKMILPTPAAARTQVAAVASVAAKPQARPQVAADPAAGVLTAPAPGPGMHDPFVQSVSDQIVPIAAAPAPKPVPAPRTASLKAASVAPLAIPFAPALPSAGGRVSSLPVFTGGPAALPAAPTAPAVPVAPLWTVTGVLQSGAEHVAILRSGEARRFVKQGDFLDSQFIVTSVTRDTVVLRHGHSRFILPLGGTKADPAGKASATPGNAANPGPPVESAFRPATATVRPVFHAKPRLKPAKPAAPEIARLSAPAWGGESRAALVRCPAARPTIRVADYQSETRSTLFPTAGGRGLLPSGMEAPDFSLATLGGQTFSLSQFRGSVVVLDFWASWYAPSARSLPGLEQLQKDLGSQGLVVMAVNSWDSAAGMQAALQGGEGSTMQLYDPGVSNASVAVQLYHAPDVPTFYVIDREGRVAGAFVGCGQGTIRNIQAILAKLGIIS